MGTPRKNLIRKTQRAARASRARRIPHHNKYEAFSVAPGERSLVPKCAGKLAFPSPEEARALSIQHGQYIYRCQLCRRYHLTSKPPIVAEVKS